MVWFESDGELKIMENAIKKGLLLALCENEHATSVKKKSSKKRCGIKIHRNLT